MPPEPLPLDRKDFFIHEGPVPPTWSHPDFTASTSRWGSPDFPTPPGQARQGGWHVFSDEYGHHGYGPSVSHGDGNYARNGSRESRSFSQRYWKGHSWPTNDGSTSNGARLQHDLNYDHRSVHDMLIYPSHSHPDFVNPRDKVKGQHDKIDEVNGLGTHQRRHRDYSASSSGWKPLKWTRSGGFSSRSSTTGHSISTKSTDAIDPNETKSETVLSPSGDPAECAMSSLPYDEGAVRKKPRLGWGEGLAKYEKKKVDVPDAFTIVNVESTHSLNSSSIEEGNRGSGFSNYASPATPSSVICGSSPGGDEKSSGKASSDNDVNNFGSPGSGFQNQYDGTPSNLEKLDDFSVLNLGSPQIRLLQPNDSTLVDSTAMSKLLIYKSEISKVLETTESEIDSLENELKGCFSFPLASSSLLVGDKYFEEDNDIRDMNPPATTLPVVTSTNIISKKMKHCTSDSEEVRTDVQESIIMREKLIISGCSEDNVMSSVDNNLCLKSEDTTFKPISSDMYEYADERGNNVFDLILASNKESAYKASEALIRLLPANDRKIDNWGMNACSQKQCILKERFVEKKRLSRFKERVVALKFKGYQSLWKESLHVPPVRKLRTKSKKKRQLSLWTNYSGYQKYRTFNRCRMPSPGNPNPVSNKEILKHVSKQLSNPQTKQYRRTLKMPALILDQKDKMASKFVSNNGLVEDPWAVEKERVMINPWTSEEKYVFIEKFECFGKDFGKIASFLDHKTTADCIEFYYKNHKSDCFEKTKKLEFGKKAKSSTSNYLMTTGKKWNPETNAATSLGMLGAASAMTIQAHKYSSSRRSCGRTSYHTTQFNDNLSERAKSFHIFGNEREKVAADVLAGISGSLSSEAMGSSCVTSTFDLKRKKGATTVLRRCLTAANIQQYANDDEVCSDESCGEMDLSYWTDGEKSLFIEAVTVHGKNFSMISTHVGSKSTNQCKVFFSKARKCLGLDLICSAKKMPRNGDNCKDAKVVGSLMIDDLPKSVTLKDGGESKESNLSSKTSRSNAVDAYNRKDSSHSAFDDDCLSVSSANDKKGSVHNQQQDVSNRMPNEQAISARISVEKEPKSRGKM